MTHLRLVWTLVVYLLGSNLPAIAAGCPEKVREFALLAQMDMAGESVAAYRVLHAECAATLLQFAGPTELPLPATSNAALVLDLGRRLYSKARDQHALQVGKALNDGEIPSASADALRGLGPENAARALWGTVLDVAAAGMDSRRQSSQAQALRETADTLRGEENKRWSIAGTSSMKSARVGPSGPSQPVIGLPAQILASASCSGRFDFLAPLLRPYTAPEIAAIRTEALNLSVPELVSAAKRHPGGKAEVLRLLRLQVQEHDRVANEAAHTANSTDGKGSVSIPAATSDTLPLDFSCGGVSIHPASVCVYNANRWASLQNRASMELVDRCWE